MKKVLYFLFILVGLTYALSPAAPSAFSAGPDSSWTEFQTAIRKTHNRLQASAAREPFDTEYLNESLEKTAEASQMMLEGAPPEAVRRDLDEALERYPENAYAVLLKAILEDVSGNRVRANSLFKEFLVQSRRFSNFESVFIPWNEYHQLRKSVYRLLKIRQVPSLRPKELRLGGRPAIREFVRYVSESKMDRWVNVIFLIAVLAGGAGLALASLLGVDFSRRFIRSLAVMYLVLWAAYMIWLWDIAAGLPFDWRRTRVVPVFLLVCFALLIMYDVLSLFYEKHRPLEKGLKRCPYCGEIMVSLMRECPRCRRPQPK